MTTLQTKKKEQIRWLLWRCQSRQPGALGWRGTTEKAEQEGETGVREEVTR